MAVAGTHLNRHESAQAAAPRAWSRKAARPDASWSAVNLASSAPGSSACAQKHPITKSGSGPPVTRPRDLTLCKSTTSLRERASTQRCE